MNQKLRTSYPSDFFLEKREYLIASLLFEWSIRFYILKVWGATHGETIEAVLVLVDMLLTVQAWIYGALITYPVLSDAVQNELVWIFSVLFLVK